MTLRSHSEAVVFQSAFMLKGVDRLLPAGSYRVVTEEESIEGVSFPAYRRLSTVIFVPAQSHRGAWEMVGIEPADLVAARARDSAQAPGAPPPNRSPGHDHR